MNEDIMTHALQKFQEAPQTWAAPIFSTLSRIR